MHILMIYVDGMQGPFGFIYRDREKAQEIYDRIRGAKSGDVFDLTDDFGRQASIRNAVIKLPQLTEITAEVEGQMEVQALQARAQQKVQDRANIIQAMPPKLVRPDGVRLS